MSLVFTEHALARLAKRQLERELIERIVSNPARIEGDAQNPTLEHRLAVVPELANRVLRVIVSKTEPKRVITANLHAQGRTTGSGSARMQ